MPFDDLTATIASLPPLRFVPAAEAPAGPLYLIGPSIDHDWSIAYRTAEGAWALNDSDELIEAPLFAAALPALRAPQPALERLACQVADQIIARRFTEAARLIDELADAVRAVRDTKPGP